MSYMDSNGSYFFWDWILWVGFILLMFSSIGTWGYTYRAHRKFDGSQRKDAATILNERYASGEITRDQYREMKLEIAVV